MPEAVVTLSGVTKSYPKREVLKGADLSVNAGEICALSGRSGSGKTTILRIITGLTSFQAGTLTLFGESSPQGLRKARGNIGTAFSGGFFDYMSASQSLAYYCALKGIPKGKRQDEIRHALELSGLSGVKIKYRNFSLGMRKRLAMANAMLGEPKLILVDEPFNGLDPQGVLEIRGLLRLLNETTGCAILLTGTERRLDENSIADSLYVIEDGRIRAVAKEGSAS